MNDGFAGGGNGIGNIRKRQIVGRSVACAEQGFHDRPVDVLYASERGSSTPPGIEDAG